MKKLMKSAWKQAIASLLGLVVVSTASGQQPPIQAPSASVPQGLPEAGQPMPVSPIPPSLPSSLPNSPQSGMPQPGSPIGTTTIPSGTAPTQPVGPGTYGIPDGLPTRVQVGTQLQPGFAAQPPPFQVSPDTPAASNDPNTFGGFPQVQNAFDRLLAGNFRDTKYKWYGFVRLDGIYDFRPIASTDSFVTSTIPVPQGRGQNSVITPRATRIGWDTETPIKSLDWTLKTRIETDFFNGNTSGAFGSFPIRLRFAWADFGPFLIGQAASLFMDYDVYPNVLDYQGPGSMILMRQPIISVHFPVGEKLKFSIGVEQPYSDIQWLENGQWIVNPGSGIITTPGVARNIQDVPDLTANVRYAGDYGHLQTAGIVRKLTYQPATGDSALDDVGYGINLTGTFHPWAFLCHTPRSGDCATAMSKSRFMWQVAGGRGISRYLNDVNGLGLDASFDPFSGFRTIPSYGWFVAYEQWWGKKWASNFTYGQDALSLTSTLPDNTYQGANYVTANIIWLPIERMGIGLEYLYGYRKNKNGQKGDDSRIQMAFQYRF